MCKMNVMTIWDVRLLILPIYERGLYPSVTVRDSMN
uniref:Uncharacterized protein n=1 Tax=viral metagenome TaxID=1070528 RepID=A0A6C0BNG3_9ZZZZ